LNPLRASTVGSRTGFSAGGASFGQPLMVDRWVGPRKGSGLGAFGARSYPPGRADVSDRDATAQGWHPGGPSAERDGAGRDRAIKRCRPPGSRPAPVIVSRIDAGQRACAPRWRLGLKNLTRTAALAMTPSAAEAFSPGRSEAAVNGCGLTLGPFPSNRSNHDCQRHSPVIAAPPRGRRQGFRRGDCR
jgi:hypothetical protein